MNFFNVALRKRKFRESHYADQIKNVYDYIEKHLKKTLDTLSEGSFDLELCFSLLERQIKEAQVMNNIEELRRLVNIHFQLNAFVAEVLSDFEHFAYNSNTMRNFGKVVFYEQPVLITFNYDCLLESILEITSGVNVSIPTLYRGRVLAETKEL
jgi:hypothetical protein